MSPPQNLTSHSSNASILELPSINTKSVGHEFVFQMREAGNTPSALADFLADPYVVEFHRKQNENHNGLKDYRKMTSRMQKNLIEPQEHLVRFLKELLRNAADHLEYEMRRANDAELRAGFAELSAKDVAGKLAAAEGDKARADGAHVAERQLHRTQLEKTREELKGLRRDIRSAERLKDQFEGASIRAKEMNIHYRENISKWKRYEEGVQQGHEIEVANSFDEGRVRGWQEGFEEGRNTGHQEGLVAGMREGKEQGRKEERKNALEAFDKFLANEMGESDDRSRNTRIRQWADSIYTAASEVLASTPSSSRDRRRRPGVEI